MAAGKPSGANSGSPYHLTISRLTIDKLGVKLYDKVSAVVAELIANSYDADAETVTVRLPLNVAMATTAGGEVKDKGLSIEVVDDGHGMTPDEARSFYLKVGTDRRARTDGALSREKKRPVMGRKGIGQAGAIRYLPAHRSLVGRRTQDTKRLPGDPFLHGFRQDPGRRR